MASLETGSFEVGVNADTMEITSLKINGQEADPSTMEKFTLRDEDGNPAEKIYEVRTVSYGGVSGNHDESVTHAEFRANGLAGEMDVKRDYDKDGNIIHDVQTDEQHLFERYETFDSEGESEDYAYRYVIYDSDGDVMREDYSVAYDTGDGLEDIDADSDEFDEKVADIVSENEGKEPVDEDEGDYDAVSGD